MGSFRSASARASDQGVLTAADRPAGVPETDEAGTPCWLGPEESITYWRVLPHGAAARIASAATHAVVDRRGRIADATYDPGKAAIARIREGIVDWRILDEHGSGVPWDARAADALVDGLPPAVVTVLGERIGSGAPPSLSAPVADAAREGETEGNA